MITKAAAARNLERAKNNLLVLQFDIPRAEVALRKAKAAHDAAKRKLERMYKRQAEWQAEWQARAATHAAELAVFGDS